MKKFKIDITRDEHAWNPREDSNLTTMVCFHKRYDLGDKHEVDGDAYSSWEEMEEALLADGEIVAMKPLYLLDHGSIAISTKDFNDRWDSGRLGLVYITKQSLMEICGTINYTEGEFSAMIEDEVEIYNNYINGNVYEYRVYEHITDESGNEYLELIGQCGGYYDEDDARTEAESLVSLASRDIPYAPSTLLIVED